MNKLKKRVHQVLKEHPGARQTDNILMVILWSQDLRRINSNTAKNGYKGTRATHLFFDLLMHNELTNWESATRVRRELQKNHPELRDKEVYKKRNKRAEEYREYYSSRYNHLGSK